MGKKYAPISSKLPHMIHGADYNPDQWLKYPNVLEEDIRLMKLSNCNVMSVGIFSWVSLEPEEGVFTFEWLDHILDHFAANGIFALLATPSGARPAWMSMKYPEVLRVNRNRERFLHGKRHKHCYTSPVYLRKVEEINRRLAQRYAYHPAVIGWHVSNEYNGDCHCNYCQAAFREWLKRKYITLDDLNHAWWSSFWSLAYTEWSQIESPSPNGLDKNHGLNLDWKRFVTAQTVQFYRHEIRPLKEVNPDLPATTNFMGIYQGLNYWKFADVVDFVSWDSYPLWHEDDSEIDQAVMTGMIHDINRSIKGGKPFAILESTSSTTNWMPASKLKRPGMHLLSTIQAIAHGSDSMQYFQWRKSRGSSEKFHGAVVDHCGHEHTRVFRDVAGVGETLAKLDEIVGTSVESEVAIIFDWENRWALNDAQGPRNCGLKYEETVITHYRTFWEQGVPVDVIDMECDFSKYKMLVAPMLYMIRPGVGERISRFVEDGGIFVATYWSGIVDEHDLCFLNGFPGPLRTTLGIWSEEIDSLYDNDHNGIVMAADHPLGWDGEYELEDLCDLIHVETAEVLARYQSDFYAGRPALTVNRFGKGHAFYIASRNKQPFYSDFYGDLIQRFAIRRIMETSLPHGVTMQMRSDGETDFIFLLNFGERQQTVALDEHQYWNGLTGEPSGKEIVLEKYGVDILKRRRTG